MMDQRSGLVAPGLAPALPRDALMQLLADIQQQQMVSLLGSAGGGIARCGAAAIGCITGAESGAAAALAESGGQYWPSRRRCDQSGIDVVPVYS